MTSIVQELAALRALSMDELVARHVVEFGREPRKRDRDAMFRRIAFALQERRTGGLPNVARLAVTEELLRAGAPVAAHWIGDRQIGPSVLRHGSPELQAEILPGIISADFVFCLGMSEPEAGSDLASVRTSAARQAGGWQVRGRKIWTSAAHRATHAYLLARTERADRGRVPRRPVNGVQERNQIAFDFDAAVGEGVPESQVRVGNDLRQRRPVAEADTKARLGGRDADFGSSLTTPRAK